MDVWFDIINLNKEAYGKLTEQKDLSAFFDKTIHREIKILPRTTTGQVILSGLTESYGFKGKWSFGIACQGAFEEAWQGFTAGSTMSIDGGGSSLFVTIDGGDLSAEIILDAVASLVELIEFEGNAETYLDCEAGAPIELYYRPPLSYYDDFLLSSMDNDTLAQLERRLIE